MYRCVLSNDYCAKVEEGYRYVDMLAEPEQRKRKKIAL